MKDSYTQGAIDAMATWGSACGSQINCESCAIGKLRGTEVSCQEFAKQFPQKFLSLIREMEAGSTTYAQEFHMRFPQQEMDVDTLVEMGICRRLIFEGFTECESSECKECWSAPYISDVEGEYDIEGEDSEDEEF